VGNGRHGELNAAVLSQETEAVVQVGERPEAEEIDLEEVHCLHVILVPLDDRPVRHCRVLNGHQAMETVMLKALRATLFNWQTASNPLLKRIATS